MTRIVELEPSDDYDYETWEQIAKALGVGVRTAQRYARERGLKVAKGPGRVVCKRSWIKTWLAKNYIVA